jgi:hypothetical protein
MSTDKIKELARELWKNEELAIELANEIFELRNGEPEKFKIPDDFMITGKDREILELVENRSYRLLELAAYFRGLKEYVNGEENCYVGYDVAEQEWEFYSSNYVYAPYRVYMTKEVAIRVCELLNSGQYSLDGDN